MEMDAELKRAGEDKDVLIQRSNKALVKAGFAPLFGASRFTRGELKETIKIMESFTEQKPKIVLHFNKFTDMDKMRQFTEHVATHKFPTKAFAKHFIEKVIREAWEVIPEPSKKWHNPDRLAINNWIVITADGPVSLEDIMESSVPKHIKLPYPYDAYAESIMAYHWGSHPQINAHTRDKSTDVEKYKPEMLRKDKEEPKKRGVTIAPQKENLKKAAEKRTPKSTEGMISLATICAALKIDPKEARGALRKANYPKPAEGWVWKTELTDKIAKDVKAAVEKARKK